ncbi:rod shape-determining protein MreD [Aquicoccus sp. SCR17]|nr:rod shape-determining protein MreD [Carideicomes alvinocaridis]
MAETDTPRLWLMRGAYLALALLIMFFQLLPLETMPRRWAAPDLLMALTLAWTVRRPAYVPMLSIAFVMLLSDLLFQRPPGLHAGLTVLACEWLRHRSRALRDSGFAAEWLNVALALAAIVSAGCAILAVTLTYSLPLGLIAMQMVLTIAIYPLVVLVSHLAFGLRRTSPGEAATMGGRL